jgi:hypothetical protein
MLPHCTSTIYHTCSTSFGLKYSQIIDVYILHYSFCCQTCCFIAQEPNLNFRRH